MGCLPPSGIGVSEVSKIVSVVVVSELNVLHGNVDGSVDDLLGDVHGVPDGQGNDRSSTDDGSSGSQLEDLPLGLDLDHGGAQHKEGDEEHSSELGHFTRLVGGWLVLLLEH